MKVITMDWGKTERVRTSKFEYSEELTRMWSFTGELDPRPAIIDQFVWLWTIVVQRGAPESLGETTPSSPPCLDTKQHYHATL